MRKRLLVAIGLSGVISAGCGGEEEKEACESDLQFFQKTVSAPIIQSDCINCHSPQGEASDSKLVFLSPGETNYLQINFDKLKQVGSLEQEGTSLLLLKPTGEFDHGGGTRFDRGSDGYEALEELLARFKEPVQCEGVEPADEVMEKVELLDLPETLRKAKVQLIGQLPTQEELDSVSLGGQEAFESLVLGYLGEDVFYDTLKLWWNDRLLTDKYFRGNDATNLLNDEVYPNRRYYDELDDETEEGRLARQHSNSSVAREPLDLIAYVVRNDKPFTEILTADYSVFNPFSARVYDVNIDFDDPLNPNEFKEGRIDGVPHAGVLTSAMFLNRFPTTDTNRNRHRSRMVWDLFLATDILKKADRPVDPTQIQDHNPTMNNKECNVCHAQMDPLAGAFMNWTAMGRYVPPEEGWFTDMRPPGFSEESKVPPAEWTSALQWVANEIAQDDRFALSATYSVYTGMVGRSPVSNPTDATDPLYEAKLTFYNLEQKFLREAQEAFVASGYNLKSLVPIIALSPFYRATSAAPLTEAEEAVLAPLGTMRLLTPEELNARIIAVTGQPWQRRADDRNLLLHRDQYLYFYGGIDSDNVTKRITEPNGMMANIALRMSNEMACFVTVRELEKKRELRKLFPHVETSFRPMDDNGFEIPEAVEAIRANIRHLHYHLLGELLAPGDPEEEATYRIFLETWDEGYHDVQAELMSRDVDGHCRTDGNEFNGEPIALSAFNVVRETDDGEEGVQLRNDENYTVRAWMAVVSYLLADWRFIYHQ